MLFGLSWALHKTILATFLDAIASPSTYPCQSMGQWVSDSFRFGDSYCISELCELVYHWVQRGLRPVDPITPVHMHSKVWHTNFLTYLLTERQPRTSLLYVLVIDTVSKVSARVEQITWQMPWWLQTSKHPGRFVDHLPDRSNPWIILLLFSIDFFVF